jgi:hypothetical protein
MNNLTQDVISAFNQLIHAVSLKLLNNFLKINSPMVFLFDSYNIKAIFSVYFIKLIIYWYYWQ